MSRRWEWADECGAALAPIIPEAGPIARIAVRVIESAWEGLRSECRRERISAVVFFFGAPPCSNFRSLAGIIGLDVEAIRDRARAAMKETPEAAFAKMARRGRAGITMLTVAHV